MHVHVRAHTHTSTHTRTHKCPWLSAHAQANTHLSCCSWLWKGQVVRCRQDQSSRCQRTCPNAYRLHTMAHKSLWEGRYRQEWAVIHDINSLTIEAIRTFPQQRQPSILSTQEKKVGGQITEREILLFGAFIMLCCSYLNILCQQCCKLRKASHGV